MRTKEETEAIYERHVDTVYRLCRSFMRNVTDAEDMTQETFVQVMRSEVCFASSEHEKAWLIVTASNLCRNCLKARDRKHEALEQETAAEEAPAAENPVTEAILALPPAYKTAVYLYYYEEYSVKEIADCTGSSVSAVKLRLMRARKKLKEALGDYNG